MVYVVDDTADYRFLVQQVFTRYLPQYPLRLFADGLDLMRYVEQYSDSSETEQVRSEPTWPSLIVLDIDMPKLNGFQTLERLKQYPRWQAVPVVVMSNRSDPALDETAQRQGAYGYITKPVNITDLQRVMEQLCHQWLDQQRADGPISSGLS